MDYQTIDELISQRAKMIYGEQLNQLLDPDAWTAENRETMLEKVRDVLRKMEQDSKKYLEEMLTTVVEGECLLVWELRRQTLGYEMNLLENFRAALDRVVDSGLPSAPVSYQWVTARIRERMKELETVARILQEAYNDTGDVEEL